MMSNQAETAASSNQPFQPKTTASTDTPCDDVSVSEQTSPTYASTSTAASSFEEQFLYKPTASEACRIALQTLQERLSARLQPGDQLRLLSMKESFELDVLTKFYDELMIPNFPLEEERDDLEDWLLYLDPANALELSDDGPTMDVLILVIGTTILGGIAFEYYPQAHAGLLSYMVVSTDYRRLGILATLHPVFSEALQSLHEVTSRTTTPIQAILAETNTTTAGDVPEAVARKRHEILYKLGYRLLEFPYVQPPLAPDVESFDDIMLLVYVGADHPPQSMATQVLYDYVLDFYHSVFGYASRLDFQDHWYYQLVTWYAQRYPSTQIQADLPWEDVTPKMKQLMEQESSSLRDDLVRDGFVKIPPSVFSLTEEQVETLRTAFEDLWNGQYETGIYPDEIHWRKGISRDDATREICNGWKADSRIEQVVCGEALGKLAASLMNWSSTRLAQDDVLHKPPRSGPVGFHQDGAYISTNFVPLVNNGLTLWMALDDADSENGALQYAPGSHLWKQQQQSSEELSFHVTEGQDHLTSLRQAAAQAGVDPTEAAASVVTVPVKTGELLVHNQDVWHGSGPNTSSTRHRRALVAHLMDGQVHWRAERPHYIYGRYYLKGESVPREDFFPFTYRQQEKEEIEESTSR